MISQRVKDALDPEKVFERYIQMVFAGIPIGPVQKMELKKAFFGAMAFLLEVQLHFIARISDDEAIEAQQFIYEQVQAFASGLASNGKGGVSNEEVVSSTTNKPH